jgi:antitoxin component of MazEF toxin-antitoxin module
MAVQQVLNVKGKLQVVIPNAQAKAIRVTHGSKVLLTVRNGQIVVEPIRETATDAEVNRAFKTILARHGRLFQRLADYDAGRRSTP